MTVSLIVPVYNAGQYLDEFLDSVKAQTFTEFQTVLVDDGSTDGSGEKLDAFAADFHDCKVIHKQNGGVVSAWKRGVSEADGEYLAFADPDDIMSPDMLETQYKLMTENSADLVIVGVRKLKDGEIRPMGIQFLKLNDGLYEGEKLENIKRELFGSQENPRAAFRFFKQNKMFRRDAVLSALGFTDDAVSYGDDICISAAAVYDSKRLYICKTPLYTYRVHGDSITTASYSPEDADNAKRIIESVTALAADRGFLNEHIVRGYPAFHIVRLVKKICRENADKKRKKQNLAALRKHPLVAEFSTRLAKKHLTRGKLGIVRLLKLGFYAPLISHLRKSEE